MTFLYSSLLLFSRSVVRHGGGDYDSGHGVLCDLDLQTRLAGSQ